MTELRTKLWGTAEDLVLLPQVEVSRAWILPGHQCSVHYHQNKANAFYLVSGKLDVTEWPAEQDGNGEWVPERVRHMVPGDFVVVSPGTIHGFQNNGVERACCLEIYWPSSVPNQWDPLKLCHPNDISRYTEGGPINV